MPPRGLFTLGFAPAFFGVRFEIAATVDLSADAKRETSASGGGKPIRPVSDSDRAS